MITLLVTLFGVINPQVNACQREALIIAEVQEVNYKTCNFKVSNFSYYSASTVCPLSKSLIKSSGVYVPGYCEHIEVGEFIQGVVFYKKGTIQLDR